MEDKEYKEMLRLCDHIMTVSEVSCTKCYKQRKEFLNDDDLAEKLYNSGWRGTENNVYCPSCAKKYLKSKNNG